MRPEWVAGMLFLFGNALWDIRTSCIHPHFTLAFLAEGLAYSLMAPRPAAELLIALSPGLLLFGSSVISRGAIGGGDGIALAVLGFFLDIQEILAFACIAFAAAGLGALGLMLVRRKTVSFPFLPFLFLGGLAATLIF